jgi:2-oxoglutarate dehydrogenase E1 component
VNKADVKTLVFCTKFYYELTAEREKNERRDVAIVRIEQLFPLPVAQLKEIIAKYQMLTITSGRKKSQKNMGAYSFMLMNFNLVKWRLASLKAYSASASGSSTRAKRRMADAIRMVLIKIYLIIRSYFLILKPRDASTKLKVGAAFSVRAKIQQINSSCC